MITALIHSLMWWRYVDPYVHRVPCGDVYQIREDLTVLLHI